MFSPAIVIATAFSAILSLATAHAAPVGGNAAANWVEELKSHDQATRTSAAYGLNLRRKCTPEEMALLLKALHSENPFVRRYVAASLGDLTPVTEETIRVLIEGLSDRDVMVGRQAAVALSKIGSTAIPMLVERLAKLSRQEYAKPGGGAATGLVFALASFGDAIVGPLIEIAKREAQSPRRGTHHKFEQCVELLLQKHVGMAAVPSLVATLQNHNHEEFALQLLRGIDPVGSLAKQWNDSDPAVREFAKSILSPDFSTERFIGKLVEQLSNANVNIQLAAIEAVGDASDWAKDKTAVTMPLVELALSDPNDKVLEAALLNIRIGNEKTLPARTAEILTGEALKVLGNSTGERRFRAIKVLTAFDASRVALPELLKCLNDSECSEAVGTGALAAAIEQIGATDIEAVQGLTTAILRQNDPHAWMLTLSRLGPAAREAIPTLIKWLLDETISDAQVASAIVKMGPDGIDALVPILNDNKVRPDVIKNICLAISAEGAATDERIRACLRALLENTDAPIKLIAAEALVNGGDPESARSFIHGYLTTTKLSVELDDELLTVLVRTNPETVLGRLNAESRDAGAILKAIIRTGTSDERFINPIIGILCNRDRDHQEIRDRAFRIEPFSLDPNRQLAAEALGQFGFHKKIIQALRDEMQKAGGSFRISCLNTYAQFIADPIHADALYRKVSTDARVDETISDFYESVEYLLSGSESAGGPDNEESVTTGQLPEFPWRPPHYSTAGIFGRDFPRDLLGNDESTLASIHKRIYEALQECDANFEASLFDAPGGFVILSNMERIEADGTPLPGKRRWVMGKLPINSLADYVSCLFFEKPGFFRVIAFVITDQTNFKWRDDVKLPVVSDGGTDLPKGIAAMSFKGRQCYALIYSFERKPGASFAELGGDVVSAKTHLSKAGFLNALATVSVRP